jgi:hypothetical protein
MGNTVCLSLSPPPRKFFAIRPVFRNELQSNNRVDCIYNQRRRISPTLITVVTVMNHNVLVMRNLIIHLFSICIGFVYLFVKILNFLSW